MTGQFFLLLRSDYSCIVLEFNYYNFEKIKETFYLAIIAFSHTSLQVQFHLEQSRIHCI